jgi:hypothetical protein
MRMIARADALAADVGVAVVAVVVAGVSVAHGRRAKEESDATA